MNNTEDKPILHSFQVVELATKQGYENKEITSLSDTTNLLSKWISKDAMVEIYVSIVGWHQFFLHINNLYKIEVFNVDYENLQATENELKKVLEFALYNKANNA